jgi:hypothetical protein
MSVNKAAAIKPLTISGIALVVTQLLRMLFGGYLAGLDQFYYNDLESAWTVFVIYVIVAIFTTLFLLGRKKPGLIGLIALSIILLIMESLYIIIYVSAPIPDPTWHDPFASWWSLVSNYAFPLLTLLLAIIVFREKPTQLNEV